MRDKKKTYRATMYKVTEEMSIKIKARNRVQAEFEARYIFPRRKRGWVKSSIERLYRVVEEQ